jgi:TfoX/Sxy family transcriptional regulator of competence genes
MAYDEKLADRIRDVLVDQRKVEEKKMFRGLTFMVNGKMCICVSGDDMMVRFDPARQEEISERTGFRMMKMKGRNYAGFGYVSQDVLSSNREFKFWVDLCLEFNKKAKAARKKK